MQEAQGEEPDPIWWKIEIIIWILIKPKWSRNYVVVVIVKENEPKICIYNMASKISTCLPNNVKY